MVIHHTHYCCLFAKKKGDSKEIQYKSEMIFALFYLKYKSTQETGFGKSLFKVQGPGILKVCAQQSHAIVLHTFSRDTVVLLFLR